MTEGHPAGQGPAGYGKGDVTACQQAARITDVRPMTGMDEREGCRTGRGVRKMIRSRTGPYWKTDGGKRRERDMKTSSQGWCCLREGGRKAGDQRDGTDTWILGGMGLSDDMGTPCVT